MQTKETRQTTNLGSLLAGLGYGEEDARNHALRARVARLLQIQCTLVGRTHILIVAAIDLGKHIIESPIDLLNRLQRCVHAVFRSLHRVGKLTAYGVIAEGTQTLLVLPYLLHLLQNADSVARNVIRGLEAMIAAIHDVRPIFDKMMG